MSPPTTAAAYLCDLADWIDVADEVIDEAFAAQGQERPCRGDQVQRDLRVWAEWMKDHPEVGTQLMEAIVTVQHCTDERREG